MQNALELRLGPAPASQKYSESKVGLEETSFARQMARFAKRPRDNVTKGTAGDSSRTHPLPGDDGPDTPLASAQSGLK